MVSLVRSTNRLTWRHLWKVSTNKLNTSAYIILSQTGGKNDRWFSSIHLDTLYTTVSLFSMASVYCSFSMTSVFCFFSMTAVYCLFSFTSVYCTVLYCTVLSALSTRPGSHANVDYNIFYTHNFYMTVGPMLWQKSHKIKKTLKFPKTSENCFLHYSAHGYVVAWCSLPRQNGY